MNVIVRGIDDETHLALKVLCIFRGESLNKFFLRTIKGAIERDPDHVEALSLVRATTGRSRRKRNTNINGDEGAKRRKFKRACTEKYPMLYESKQKRARRAS